MKKGKAQGGKKKKKTPQLGNEQLFEALIPAARLAVSVCTVSLSLSLSVTVLSLPLSTRPLTFSLEFLWKICKSILLPLGLKINCTIPTWGKPKI